MCRQRPDSAGALVLLAQLGREPEHRAVVAALADDTLRSAAVFALGFAGTRAAADLCAELLDDKQLTRLAAEALCAITGLDLANERLLLQEPEAADEPVAFEAEDLDANLVPSPEQQLPLPDAAGVRRWWHAKRPRFSASSRYADGEVVTLQGLLKLLQHGPLRRRHATALELAVRTQGRCQVQTRAFSGHQRLQLARLDPSSLPQSTLAADFSAL